MRVLGIETSCDETAVAIVTDKKEILAHAIYTQLETHQQYGGVVPEVSSRGHLEILPHMVSQALTEANLSLADLDGIAATCGPGLIGGVLVGATFAKAIALYHQKPFMAVNHLEGHALTVQLTHDVPFPYLLLLVSGGHTQILLVKDLGDYALIGTTKDDALGEAFDKTARLMGLPYPGGPKIEAYAHKSQTDHYAFPRPMIHKPGYDFSFSGLKTAVRFAIEKEPTPLSKKTKANIAYSFQEAAIAVIKNRLKNVFQRYHNHFNTFVVAGGVAANQAIRQSLEEIATQYQKQFVAPPLHLCTDNGAMIAWAGLSYLKRGKTSSLDFKPRPRWPLDTLEP